MWKKCFINYMSIMVNRQILKEFCVFIDLFSDINECASNPCGVNGACVDAINSYECICSGGFTGTRCEQLGMELPITHNTVQSNCHLYSRTSKFVSN